MASVKLTTVTSSLKGFHVYRRSPDIGEDWCVLEERNKHSNTAIKVFGDDKLSKVVAPALKKRNRAFS